MEIYLPFNHQHHTTQGNSQAIPKNPYVTPEIEQLIRAKRAAFCRFKNKSALETRLDFTTLKNRLTRSIRKNERAQATTLHRSHRSSMSAQASHIFWHHIRSLTGKNQKSAFPD